MSVWARGINASVVESDIGTVNGVIHIIDRVLGVPYMTIGQYMESDPDMRYGVICTILNESIFLCYQYRSLEENNLHSQIIVHKPAQYRKILNFNLNAH